jgi:hypothetical protein
MAGTPEKTLVIRGIDLLIQNINKESDSSRDFPRVKTLFSMLSTHGLTQPTGKGNQPRRPTAGSNVRVRAAVLPRE